MATGSCWVQDSALRTTLHFERYFIDAHLRHAEHHMQECNLICSRPLAQAQLHTNSSHTRDSHITVRPAAIRSLSILSRNFQARRRSGARVDIQDTGRAFPQTQILPATTPKLPRKLAARRPSP